MPTDMSADKMRDMPVLNGMLNGRSGEEKPVCLGCKDTLHANDRGRTENKVQIQRFLNATFFIGKI